MPNPILEDIVVHEFPPTPMEVIESHQEPIDFGTVEVIEDSQNHHMEPMVQVIDSATNENLNDLEDHLEEFVVELHGNDSDLLSVEVPEDNENIPEGADVVVTHNDDPVLAIDLGDLPGAPSGTPDPKEEEEEEEDDAEEEQSSSKKSSEEGDKNDAKDSKKDDRWDWKSKGFGKFTIWVRDRFESVPKHSGYSEAGLERAQAYLERLHGEISKAMRSDIDGELDSDLISKMHEQIETGIEKLQNRLEKVRSGKKKKKKADENYGLVKEGQKVFGIQPGVVVMVPLFISTLARVLINGSVSAGKDIEHSYEMIVKKYKLSDREKMELIQLVQDMGFPTIRDRSLLPDEVLERESTDNLDFSANYQA